MDVFFYSCVQKRGKKKNSIVAFWDSQPIQSISADLEWLGKLASWISPKAIVGFQFFLSPLLDSEVDQNMQKLEISSSKVIRYTEQKQIIWLMKKIIQRGPMYLGFVVILVYRWIYIKKLLWRTPAPQSSRKLQISVLYHHNMN